MEAEEDQMDDTNKGGNRMIEFIKTGGKKRNKVGLLTRYTNNATPNQDDSKCGLKANECELTTPGKNDRSLTPLESQIPHPQDRKLLQRNSKIE